MLAEYRHHNAVQGFIIWMSMTHLRMFNARGAMPESLSGSYYRLLDNGVPHQMFSELVGMPGLIDGVLGLDLDVPRRVLHVTPHLPPSWHEITIRRFLGPGQLDVELHQQPGRLTATPQHPASPHSNEVLLRHARAAVISHARREVRAFKTEDNGSDVHVHVTLSSVAKTTIEVRYHGGIGVDVPWQPLLEGDSSRNLHVLKTSFDNDQLQMQVEGRPDIQYEIRLWTPWRVATASSAKEILRDGDWSILRVAAPAEVREHLDKAGYVRWTVTSTVQRNQK
jgi:hypothetical protein